jgi:hypothetical protein
MLLLLLLLVSLLLFQVFAQLYCLSLSRIFVVRDFNRIATPVVIRVHKSQMKRDETNYKRIGLRLLPLLLSFSSYIRRAEKEYGSSAVVTLSSGNFLPRPS